MIGIIVYYWNSIVLVIPSGGNAMRTIKSQCVRSIHDGYTINPYN